MVLDCNVGVISQFKEFDVNTSIFSCIGSDWEFSVASGKVIKSVLSLSFDKQINKNRSHQYGGFYKTPHHIVIYPESGDL